MIFTLLRVVPFIVGLGAALWLGRNESWAVCAILAVTPLRAAMIARGRPRPHPNKLIACGGGGGGATPDPATQQTRARATGGGRLGSWGPLTGFFCIVLIAFAAAGAMHLGKAAALGGVVRPYEVFWSAWFYIGCITLLEGLGVAADRLGRRIGRAWAPPLLRWALILLIVPPGAVAVVQIVRVKTGYELGPTARRMEPIEFRTPSADGTSIHGYYFDRGHETTLVVAHGLGAHAQNFMAYLTTLLEGHAVNGLIFDFRAHGYSDGHTSSMGWREAGDAEAALAWLRARDPEAAERVIFYGFSLGSAAALRAARRTPETVGVIIDSGFARLTDVAWAMAQRMPPILRLEIYHVGLPAASLLAGAPLWRVNPIETLDHLDVPVRVVHGGADELIPPSAAEPLMRHSRTTGRFIPGGGHTNLPEADPSYFSYIGRFVDLLLPARRERRTGMDARKPPSQSTAD